MFIDRVRVKITAGAGGNGCCAFRREKYVPRGGPSGGDGGKGGDVVFRATSERSSLVDIKYHAHWKAERGEHGLGKDQHGRYGVDAIIPVPLGTLVRDFETNEILCDLVDEGQTFLAGRGGKGGRGNARFMTSTHKAPKFAELGEPGDEKEYILELKLIAEVGIVGKPNAGKSTLLSAISAARPKVDSYPFTTLTPHLGVASLSDHRTLVIADIPGIIEGAAEGRGLGHEFLRHVERTRVLLFLLDLGDEDPFETYRMLDDELTRYSDAFAGRPRVFALNKVDITENRERADEVAAQFDNAFIVSGATGEGVAELLEHFGTEVDRVRHDEEVEIHLPESEYIYEAPFTIEPTSDGFRIEGQRVRQAVRMTNFDNDEAVQFLHHRLKKMGVFKALHRMGAEEGQTITIEDVEFEYRPD